MNSGSHSFRPGEEKPSKKKKNSVRSQPKKKCQPKPKRRNKTSRWFIRLRFFSFLFFRVAFPFRQRGPNQRDEQREKEKEKREREREKATNQKTQLNQRLAGRVKYEAKVGRGNFIFFYISKNIFFPFFFFARRNKKSGPSHWGEPNSVCSNWNPFRSRKFSEVGRRLRRSVDQQRTEFYLVSSKILTKKKVAVLLNRKKKRTAKNQKRKRRRPMGKKNILSNKPISRKIILKKNDKLQHEFRVCLCVRASVRAPPSLPLPPKKKQKTLDACSWVCVCRHTNSRGWKKKKKKKRNALFFSSEIYQQKKKSFGNDEGHLRAASLICMMTRFMMKRWRN